MRRSLLTLPGVKEAQVDARGGQAVVLVQADQYDRQAMLKAVARAGYQARVLKEDGGESPLTFQR